MGLHVANAIVQAHQGSLALENTGNGTHVKLRLPRNTITA